ncbi:somatomedin-B and thrombospondin type-1 domain-containing protein-like [Branchiostoma floridae x Branchiostoma japonicum]
MSTAVSLLLVAFTVLQCLVWDVAATCFSYPQNLCCKGKNNECKTSGRRLDGTVGACFCDENCYVMRDCCSDYENACQAVACQVSEWGSWSGCSVSCGEGVSERRRYVLTSPRGGGPACPPLVQKRACYNYGYWCSSATKEVAHILPASFGHLRLSDEPKGAMGLIMDSRKSHMYCVNFRVTSTSAACRLRSNYLAGWTRTLRAGANVCVECQPHAMDRKMHCRGDGASGPNTGRWTAVDATGCRGTWKKHSRQENCYCSGYRGYGFIFV